MSDLLPFQWAWTYSDPHGYSREIPAGYKDGLWDASGNKWSYIKLQPPVRGVGRLDFRCEFTLLVENPNSREVRVHAGLGVGSVIPGAKPMYPYLGVCHGSAEDPLRYVTVEPGEQAMVSGFRLDVVDNALQSDQPIPGWPAWHMADGNNGVPPFVIIYFMGDPTLPVRVIVDNALASAVSSKG